jgi:hypothetical protein
MSTASAATINLYRVATRTRFGTSFEEVEAPSAELAEAAAADLLESGWVVVAGSASLLS